MMMPIEQDAYRYASMIANGDNVRRVGIVYGLIANDFQVDKDEYENMITKWVTHDGTPYKYYHVVDERSRFLWGSNKCFPKVVFSTIDRETEDYFQSSVRKKYKIGIIGRRNDVVMDHVFGAIVDPDAVIYDPTCDCIIFGDTGEVLSSIPFPNKPCEEGEDKRLYDLLDYFIKIVAKNFVIAKTSGFEETIKRMLRKVSREYLHPRVGVIPTALVSLSAHNLCNELLQKNELLLIDNGIDYLSFKNGNGIEDAEDVYPCKCVPSHYYWQPGSEGGDMFISNNNMRERIGKLMFQEKVKGGDKVV